MIRSSWPQSLKGWLRRVLPREVVRELRRIKNAQAVRQVRSRFRMVLLKNAGRPVTFEDLCRDLTALGVCAGMKVMVHSSLSGIGFVQGGASTVVEALLTVLGPQGLLVMPCPPITGATVEALRNKERFNPQTTTCVTGKICETFRQRPGVERSLHPTHSVAALGPEAAWLVQDHHLDPTPFGDHSPFARLVEMDGMILGLGLDVRWITLYHRFEDSCAHYPLRVYSDERFEVPVVLPDRTMLNVSVPYHDEAVSAARLNNDSGTLVAIDAALDRYGNIIRGSIGRGEAYLLRAKDVLGTLESILQDSGQTIYNLEIIRKTKPEAIRSNHLLECK